jgi:hypothetical protein
LAAFHSRSHALARQLGDMNDCVLVGVAICGQVIKIGNAGDKATVALTIDHRPVPDPVHVLPASRRTPPGASAGEMKTDRAAAAIEARATTANRTMPARASS